MGSIKDLHSLFKTSLDILRNDSEHLVGDEALNELSHFLILKQVENHINNGSIDIYNLDIYDGVDKYGKDKFLEYIEYIKFSKLVEYVNIPEKENNIENIFNNFIWKEVLSKHPKFKDVFEEGKKSFIKDNITYKKLILVLSTVDFNNYDYDILGEAYESIFVDAVFGAGGNKKSELGQFFTPPKIKKILVELVNPKINESVLDPSSGTGGILNTVIRHFKNLNVDNDHLKKNIYGIEIKGKIYNLCLSNMLINTGEILPNVICADSIRKFHNIKVDNIVANPPFSVGIKYEDINLEYKILNDYIPIKVGGKNSEMLFLQMMIYCLKKNGRCATVMLEGQKMYGSSSGYDKVREYLMRSCDLHEVILCPSGTFTSTASKTCILYFTKKHERSDVLEISGAKRVLKFKNILSTKTVKFYDYNPEIEEKKLIIEVPIEEIISNNYSLNYNDYIVKEEKKYEDIIYKSLGEICEINQGESLIKKNIINGDYNIIGGGKIIGKHNISNREGNEIVLTRVGDININFIDEPYYLTENGFSIKLKTENNIKYIYYYLINNINIIKDHYKGAAQKVISKTNLSQIKVPLPLLELQKNIVDFLDELLLNSKTNLLNVREYYKDHDIFKLLLEEKYELFKNLVEWQEQSIYLAEEVKYYKDKQKRYLYLSSYEKNNEIKSLGDIIIEFKNGKDVASINRIKGEYPFYGANGIIDYVDNYIFDGKYLLTARTGSIGALHIVNGKFWCTGHVHMMKFDNDINLSYVYYYLKIIDFKKYITGAAQPQLRGSILKSIKIPLPSLERRKEIVKYCDHNQKIIERLEKELEHNKIEGNLFISNILS